MNNTRRMGMRRWFGPGAVTLALALVSAGVLTPVLAVAGTGACTSCKCSGWLDVEGDNHCDNNRNGAASPLAPYCSHGASSHQ
jgi:hypothetical protein